MQLFVRKLMFLSLSGALALPATPSFAQSADVVVMRRVLTRPGPAIDRASSRWVVGDWSAPSSSCSDQAEETRAVRCERSDGVVLADANCPGQRPDAKRTLQSLDGCSYAWRLGDWTPYSLGCSVEAVRTRGVQCGRSDGGVADSEARCTLPKPPEREVADVSSTCTYAAAGWTGATYASACSSSTARTETATCVRSDGTPATVAACTSRGVALTRTTTSSNYAGCSYGWVYSDWGPSSSACSDFATQTRTATCTRSNGDAVAEASCTDARGPTTRTVSDLTGCPVKRTCSVQFYRQLKGPTISLGRFSTVAQVNAACSAISGVTACGFYNSSGLQAVYTTAADPKIISTGVDYAAAICS